MVTHFLLHKLFAVLNTSEAIDGRTCDRLQCVKNKHNGEELKMNTGIDISTEGKTDNVRFQNVKLHNLETCTHVRASETSASFIISHSITSQKSGIFN
jgi:hypothetical protein